MAYLLNDPALKPYRRTLRRHQTDTETRFWQRVRNKQLGGFKFYRQFGFGPYILDFYCPQCLLAIELDGGQHMEGKERDRHRAAYLHQYGIEVIRFWNNAFLENMEGALEQILNRLLHKEGSQSVTPPTPSYPIEGG